LGIDEKSVTGSDLMNLNVGDVVVLVVVCEVVVTADVIVVVNMVIFVTNFVL
jgi:hypothetical protein